MASTIHPEDVRQAGATPSPQKSYMFCRDFGGRWKACAVPARMGLETDMD
jgi:hypothetical protein